MVFFVRTKLLAIDQTGAIFLRPTASLFGTFHDSITHSRTLLCSTPSIQFDTPNRLFYLIDILNRLSYISTSFPLRFLFSFSFSLLYLETFFKL